MKQERLKELLQVAETEGSAAALKIAQDAGDVEIEQTGLSAGMQARIEARKNKESYTRPAIRGLK